jgi:saccharopine dehydrogenase (NAD+, L-lysine-forming)
MKILIVGAGAVASVISRILSKDKKTEVTCASRDIKRAKEFIDTKKVRLIKLEASSVSQVAKAAKGFDLIINASMPRFNESIMEAALKAKVNYQDLCSLLQDLKTPEQLKFHNRFAKAGLVALINTGVAPGVTNLLAAEIADKLDKVSDINFRLIEDQKCNEFIFSWSAEVTLDDLSAPPLSYKNGKFQLLDSFEDVEEYDFPPPHKKRKVMNIYGDEVSTLPRYIKVRNINFKSGGSDIAFSRALYKLGLFGQKPMILKGKSIVPREFFLNIAPRTPSPKEMVEKIKKGAIEDAYFISLVEGIGTEAGKHIRIRSTAIYPTLKNITKKMRGATYISYPTGMAAVAFSRIIPKISKKGVFPPEALEAKLRKEVLLELENNGVIIDERFSKA